MLSSEVQFEILADSGTVAQLFATLVAALSARNQDVWCVPTLLLTVIVLRTEDLGENANAGLFFLSALPICMLHAAND